MLISGFEWLLLANRVDKVAMDRYKLLVWHLKMYKFLSSFLLCFILQVAALDMIAVDLFLTRRTILLFFTKCFVVMITSMHFALRNSHFGSPTHSNCPSALVFSISRSPAQHNVFRCGNKPQFLSPLSYLSHLHVPGLSDISDVKRNLSELSVTSSVDSGFKGSGHSFRLRDRSPVRCKWNHWPCTSTARDVIHSSRDSTWYWFSI